MRNAEASFAQGNLDDALDKYQRALQIDTETLLRCALLGRRFQKQRRLCSSRNLVPQGDYH